MASACKPWYEREWEAEKRRLSKAYADGEISEDEYRGRWWDAITEYTLVKHKNKKIIEI